MTTEIVDETSVVSGQTVPIFRATVTVSYKFRNQTYRVQMNTARASDR